jgi:DNA processing protein
VAVWGAGCDRVYPAEHAALAAEIADHGALVTEYPPGSPPLAHHFPERNRIIAGLADVTVVVEADERSGALVTARLALEGDGRVPGSSPACRWDPMTAARRRCPVLAATDARRPVCTGICTDRGGARLRLPAGEAVTVTLGGGRPADRPCPRRTRPESLGRP